jgi:hypothetical protein
MASEVLKSLTHAAIVIHGVALATPKPIKASFTASLNNVLLYTSAENPSPQCTPTWNDSFTITVSKKQFDEGILEFNFLEKKSSVGIAQIPLRTLGSKHYAEAKKDGSEQATGSIGSSASAKPRIMTVQQKDEWIGFRAQMIKSDLVRGYVHVNSECTSVALIQELLSAYKTYFIGVDNLMHLAIHNPNKLALYVTPDVLQSLKIATLAHIMTEGSGGGGGTPRRRNRASTRISRVSIDGSQALANLEKAFSEAVPDQEDRYLLLALWRQLLSCPSIVVKNKLVACGLFKLSSKMLSLKEDPELVSHFLEGLKYFFILPDTQSSMTRKLKKGVNLMGRIVEIISAGALNPIQGQVVMRAMDLLYYFDEPDATKALADGGVIPALHKLAVDGSAFLALRTKALDIFKIFPVEMHKAILASGILAGFSDVISSTSNRSAHHSFLGRVLGFLAFLANADPSSIASDGIFKGLVGMLIAKNATEPNIVLALGVLSSTISKYAPLFIELGLPNNLIHVLLNPHTSSVLRTAVLDHLALPPYQDPAALEKLIQGGIMQNMFELLASSYVDDESAMVRKFLSSANLQAKQLVDAGMISALGVMLTYESLQEIPQTPSRLNNLELLLQLTVKLGPIAEFQTSAIPRAVTEVLRYAPKMSLSASAYANTLDKDRVLFTTDKYTATELVPLDMTFKILDLISTLTQETIFTNRIHEYLFITSLLDINTSLTKRCDEVLSSSQLKGWVDAFDKDRLFLTMETLFSSSLTNCSKFTAILKDLPPGYGHIPFTFKMLNSLSVTQSSFLNLFEAIPLFEAYLEFINSEEFLSTMLTGPKDPKGYYFYPLVEKEAERSSSLREKLQTETMLFTLLSTLSESIFSLKTNQAATIRQSCIVARDFAYNFLQPKLETLMPPGGFDHLITMASEPASGPGVAQWALKLLENQLPALAQDAKQLRLHETLWNIVNGCDLTVASSEGDGNTLFATQVSVAAWKLLCKLPDHLTWLHALPVFLTTVTNWFFSKQPEFQLMALAIMEPVRWARVGCKTSEEFESWRLNLNKGRLAYCSALKGTNTAEVTKLARSFANNHVVPEDLAWIASEPEMKQNLKVYLAIEDQLRPANQTEMAKEFSTLRTWLRFLRLCKTEKVKHRFIALLDTFHDSLFFMPDSTSANTDWHAYYKLDDEEAQQAVEKKLKKSVAALKASGASINKNRSVVGLRSSASAIGKATDSSKTAPIVVAKWNPNMAAHFQLIRFWQFTTLTTRVNLNDVSSNAHAVYELCYDSYRHGFNIDALNSRSLALNKLMMTIRIEPKTPKDPALGSDGVMLGFYIPSVYVWSNQMSDIKHQGALQAFSWRNINHQNQVATFNWTSGSHAGYLMSKTGIISVFSDTSIPTFEFTLDMNQASVTWNPNGSWVSKLWGSTTTSDVPVTHIQIFRLGNAPSNNRITVLTRKGFGEDIQATQDDSAAAQKLIPPPPQRAMTGLKALFSEDEKEKPKVKFADTPKRADSVASDDSTELGLQDSESFMNRHLAKLLNNELKSRIYDLCSRYPALGVTMHNGPTPTWIRIFRYSARAKTDFSQVNLLDIVRKANAEKAPLIGIIKVKQDVDGDDEGQVVPDANKKPQLVFGFYIHGGLQDVTVGPFVRDPVAMLFSLRGPSGKPPQFVPVSLDESQHAYRFVNNTTIQFGIGTDLYLNLTDHSSSFSNLGMSYSPLPDDIPFMSKEARHFFTNDDPTTWQFEDIEIYFRATSKSKISLPSPALGHLLRLLEQDDITMLQQIRWRLKYLMLSGSLENKRQILEEIRRAQLADLNLGALEPVNNLTKRVEHPGVAKMEIRAMAINGKILVGNDMERLVEATQNPYEGCVAPSDVVPFDITFAVLSPKTASQFQAIVTKEQIEAIPLDSLPYLTHAILAARKDADEPAERATRMVVFASDHILTPAELNAAFPPLQTPIDDYSKIIKSNAIDHLRWYEQHAPAALDPSKQFRIGPLLKPAEEELENNDEGMVSKAEDAYWSFLDPEHSSDKLKARAVEVPGRQCFVEDYQLDQLRVVTDPVALVQLSDNEEVGTAALSAPVRARYITIRLLPNDVNRLPLYFSTIRFLGYHAENHHYLVPPKPEAMADLLPIYTEHLLPDASRFSIQYSTDESAGIMHWLRETKHKGDLEAMETEFTLLYSHHLFDQKTMTRQQFYGAQRPDVYFWGGSAPTWFSFVYKNFTVCPKAFMLRHGYNKNNSFIQNFVFQGTMDSGKTWRDICDFPDHYHSFSGQGFVFTHDKLEALENFYNGFRVLQKGPYYMGPNAAGSPFMCISEFEVFGNVVLNKADDAALAKTYTLVDADKTLGYSSTYDSPISSIIPRR